MRRIPEVYTKVNIKSYITSTNIDATVSGQLHLQSILSIRRVLNADSMLGTGTGLSAR